MTLRDKILNQVTDPSRFCINLCQELQLDEHDRLIFAYPMLCATDTQLLAALYKTHPPTETPNPE